MPELTPLPNMRDYTDEQFFEIENALYDERGRRQVLATTGDQIRNALDLFKRYDGDLAALRTEVDAHFDLLLAPEDEPSND